MAAAGKQQRHGHSFWHRGSGEGPFCARGGAIATNAVQCRAGEAVAKGRQADRRQEH